MSDDEHKLLALLGTGPARLTVEQTACVLNCKPHDMPVLIAARLLKPLGNPPPNGLKFFATVEVLELRKNEKWLHRATDAIYRHWRNQNARRKSRASAECEVGSTLPTIAPVTA